jgi:hypothetical protein
MEAQVMRQVLPGHQLLVLVAAVVQPLVVRLLVVVELVVAVMARIQLAALPARSTQDQAVAADVLLAITLVVRAVKELSLFVIQIPFHWPQHLAEWLRKQAASTFIHSTTAEQSNGVEPWLILLN